MSAITRTSIVICLLTFFCAAPATEGGQVFWNNTTGNWLTSGNWSPGLPTINDIVYVTNNGKAWINAATGRGDRVYVGFNSGTSGDVDILPGGVLSTHFQYIGYDGTGTVTQTGGANTLSNVIWIGNNTGSHGTYNISAGSLSAYSMYVGSANAIGELKITGAAADISISRGSLSPNGVLSFEKNAKLTAVAGSTIKLDRTSMVNKSTSPTNLAGMSDLGLIFTGTGDNFEVAGKDLGSVSSGFVDNFALDVLDIGGSGGTATLSLVDIFDNQPGTPGNQALYVDELITRSGSTLHLNGLHIYTRVHTDLGATINRDGGEIHTGVPEPGSAFLLTLGILGLVGVVRRRR